MLKFSLEWLKKYKTHYKVKKYKSYREVDSVDINTINKELKKLQTMLIPYKANNIYNIDKTALYWKTIPN